MTPKEIIGYVLTLLVAPLAGWLCDHYGARDLAPILVGGLAGFGGRLLHTSDPPEKDNDGRPRLYGGGHLAPLLLALPLLNGCAFLQRPATQRIVRCTGDVISACKSDVGPTIAACLAAPANPTPCLLALVNTGSCATREALACRTRDAAEPPVIMGFTSISDEASAEQKRREWNAQRFFDDVGLVPVSP